MTTQTGLASLLGPEGGFKFSATCTDDSWTELVDEVSSLSLYKVMKGRQVTHYTGQYAAGGGIFRIFNTNTNQVKAVFLGNIITEEKVYEFPAGVTIEENDVLQAKTVAVPT